MGDRTAGTSLLLVAICLLLGACGGGPKRAATAPDSVSIVAVIKGLDNPFFSTMRDGLVAAGTRYKVGVSVDAAADVNDAAGQAARLRSHEDQLSSCYIVNPTNPTNLLSPLSLVTGKVPIINLDLPIAANQAAALGVHITTYIGTDNVAAGMAAAKAMASSIPKGGRVAVVTGPTGDPTSQARISGFRNASRGQFAVVASRAADWDTGKAKSAASDLLAGAAHLNGIFAANDLMALGVAAAVKASGRRNHVAVIGVDGIRQSLRAIERGDMTATVAQYPFTMGQMGVEACLAAMKGKKVPERIDAPLSVVTRANVASVERSFPRPVGQFDDPLKRLLAK